MFFVKDMEQTITLHPSFFGPKIQFYLKDQLYRDMEGVNTGDFYIVAIMDVLDYSDGRVMPGSGFAEYTISYRAIIWKPFKGEVVSAVMCHLAQMQLSDHACSSTVRSPRSSLMGSSSTSDP